MVRHKIGRPYTEEELSELVQNFRDMPTFVSDEKGGYVLTSDCPAVMTAMDYNKSPQEVEFVVGYFTRKNHGILTFEEFMNICKVFHDTEAVALLQAQTFDLDGNGYISVDEFDELMKAIVLHNPKLPPTSFEIFLQEADTNKDGKISIEECAAWIGKTTKS